MNSDNFEEFEDCITIGDACTGSSHCEGRKFDTTKTDCQACLTDASDAIKQADKDIQTF